MFRNLTFLPWRSEKKSWKAETQAWRASSWLLHLTLKNPTKTPPAPPFWGPCVSHKLYKPRPWTLDRKHTLLQILTWKWNSGLRIRHTGTRRLRDLGFLLQRRACRSVCVGKWGLPARKEKEKQQGRDGKTEWCSRVCVKETKKPDEVENRLCSSRALQLMFPDLSQAVQMHQHMQVKGAHIRVCYCRF